MATADYSRRKVDYDAVSRARREEGLSYSALAKRFDITESHAYYICNPNKRRSQSPLGSRRWIYSSDEAWVQLRDRADAAGISVSKLVDLILHDEGEPHLARPTPDAT